MLVLIPSRGRATQAWLEKGPFFQLPKGTDVRFCVPLEEYHDYATLNIPVVARPAEVRGMSAVRGWLGAYAQYLGVEKFIMFDDDITFFRRIDEDTTKLTRATPEDMAEMLATVETLLDDYGHVGISAREGNNRSGTGAKPLIKENTRLMRAIAYRTSDFMSITHNTIMCMSDFDATLKLLRRGIPNACLNYWAQDQRGTNTEGGCSTYRTVEMHRAACHQLKAENPDFVSLRQKENKTGGEFGKRTEVTIQWKKAFAAGEKWKAAQNEH